MESNRSIKKKWKKINYLINFLRDEKKYETNENKKQTRRWYI